MNDDTVKDIRHSGFLKQFGESADSLISGSSALFSKYTQASPAAFRLGASVAMNLPSTSYVAESESEKLSDRRNKNSRSPCEHQLQHPSPPTQSNPSPEVKGSSDMDSVYSDAGDTFPSTRPCSSNSQDSEGSVSCQPRSADGNSRDFIMRRFLPAAQAMATEASSSNATSSLASSHPSSDQRSNRNTNAVTNVVTNATLPPLPANKSRLVQEVRQDVRENSDNDGDEVKACGIPLKLGKLTLGSLKYSFWSTSRSKSPREVNANASTNPSSHHHHKKAPADGSGVSENSDDLFWSDEEYVENGKQSKSKPPIPAAPTERERLSELKNGIQQRESFRKLEAAKFAKAAATMEGFTQARGAAPARLHSMETVHTPDHKGFLGLPRNPSITSHSGGGSGGPPDAADRERAARQVDRLGARLTRMISKTNYIDARNVKVKEHEEIDGNGNGNGSQGPCASSGGGGGSLADQPHQLRPKGKWVDRVAVIGGSLRPPPSPKSPSESWLCNTLPPSRFLEVKKLSSRKPLGSYIPIKPPLKPQASREEVPSRLRQSCSLKEHLQGTRQIVSSTVHAV